MKDWEKEEEEDWGQDFHGKTLSDRPESGRSEGVSEVKAQTSIPPVRKFDFYRNLSRVITDLQNEIKRYQEAYHYYLKLKIHEPLRQKYISKFVKEAQRPYRAKTGSSVQVVCYECSQSFISYDPIENSDTCPRCLARSPYKIFIALSKDYKLNIKIVKKFEMNEPIRRPQREDYDPEIGYGLSLAHLTRPYTQEEVDAGWKAFCQEAIPLLVSNRLGIPVSLLYGNSEYGFYNLIFKDNAVSSFATFIQILRRYQVISKQAYYRRWSAFREAYNARHGRTTIGPDSYYKFKFSGITLKGTMYYGTTLYKIYQKFGWTGVEAIFKAKAGASSTMAYFLAKAPPKAKFKELVKLATLMKKFKNLANTRTPLRVLWLLPKVGVAGRLAVAIVGETKSEWEKSITQVVPSDPQKYQKYLDKEYYQRWLDLTSKLRFSSEIIEHIYGIGISNQYLVQVYRSISKDQDLDKFIKVLTSLSIIAKEINTTKQRHADLGKAINSHLIYLIPYLHKVSQKIHLLVGLSMGAYWDQFFTMVGQGKFPQDKNLANYGQLIEWIDAHYWASQSTESSLNKKALRAKWQAEISEIDSQPVTTAGYRKKKELLGKLSDLDREDHLYRLRDRRAQEDRKWATEQYPTAYQDGKLLAPLYIKIFDALRKIPGPLVIHGRDGETIYQAAKQIDPDLFGRMIYVLSSRPLTTETSSHSPQYLAYLETLINKQDPMVHIDTGFAGSIPLWFRSRGWNVKDIKLISSNTLEYGLLGQESLDYALRTTVLDKIEHIKHRLVQATPDIWGQWIYSYDAPAFWALVQGISDEMQEIINKIQSKKSRRNPQRNLIWPNLELSNYSLQDLYHLIS